MVVNGKTAEIKPGETLLDFLTGQGYRIEIIAVELNGEIIPREKFPQTVLKENDVMEIVTFMGGGC